MAETQVEAAMPSWQRAAPKEPSLETFLPSPGQKPPPKANKLGPFDVIIHNAGIGYRQTQRVETEPGVPDIFAVNVLAPYILTALIERPKRLIYVSSGMHQGVRPAMDDLLWTKRAWSGALAYAESKLCDVFALVCRGTALAEHPVERGGAGVGADKNGRPFRPGRPDGRVCHASMARYQ